MIELTDPQADFLMSRKKFCLFKAGIGSGKSFIGAHWIKKKITSDPYTVGLIGANTYRQLQNATLNTLFIELDKMRIPYSYNQQKGKLDICGRIIYCYSLDNYEPIRGIEIGYAWLDECAYAKEEAFKVVLGRLRHPKAKKLEMRMTSTPAGFNWLHEYTEGDRQLPDCEVITGTSYDNIFLPNEYVETLKSTYDEKTYRQEVLGETINLRVGQVYYGFSRKKHVKEIKLNPSYPISIGMDFNINPMTAVVCQIYGNNIYVIDELFMMTSNTHDMGDEIIKRYGPRHRIIPDATGRALKTSSAGLSDHQILIDKGFYVEGFRNPFRMDRYNCVNNLFEKGRIIVNKKCVKLIRDLEQVSFKEGSTHPDSSNKELTHISDALGYLSYWSFPIIKPTSRLTMVDR